MVDTFIKATCKVLNIDVPEISYDTSNFTTKTMMAQCSHDGSVIFLKKQPKPNPDMFFAIAHELRHIWQIKNNVNLYFADYKPIDMCESVEAYNLQIAEIDANAFGGLLMVGLFKLQPQFNGMSEAVKSKIYKRMDEIELT